VRKKSWGRLGAAVSVVALLAGGLVGVAAPAQADPDDEVQCFGPETVASSVPILDDEGKYVGSDEGLKDIEAIIRAACKDEGFDLTRFGRFNGDNLDSCKNMNNGTVWNCPQAVGFGTLALGGSDSESEQVAPPPPP
jgi:hypothetical protein